VWGNPLYKWSYHKKTGFRWWIDRLAQNFGLYDVIRLDHFRGFESFFSIPAKDKTAVNGHWMRGPGIAFFDAVKQALPGSRFIAEDLGYITPAVQKLIEKTGFPGMKVLQFAFDGDPQNLYLPEHYTENCVAYSGTHDNDTTAGWYGSLDREIRKKVTAYLRSRSGSQPEESMKAPEFGVKAATWSLVDAVMRSCAETCIIPLQDYLLYDSSARINVPGTTGDNWCWRMREGAFGEETISYILALTKGTGRLCRDGNKRSE
jgi:4-alpha-glucanotransferase